MSDELAAVSGIRLRSYVSAVGPRWQHCEHQTEIETETDRRDRNKDRHRDKDRDSQDKQDFDMSILDSLRLETCPHASGQIETGLDLDKALRQF